MSNDQSAAAYAVPPSELMLETRLKVSRGQTANALMALEVQEARAILQGSIIEAMQKHIADLEAEIVRLKTDPIQTEN